MTETYEWEELQWVPLDEWPLEDSIDGQKTANTLAPQNHQWLRSTSGEDGYYLMHYVGENND